MVVRWQFYDPSVPETYTLEINPNEGGTPTRTKTITTQPTVRTTGTPLVFEGNAEPLPFTWSGILRSEEQYDALVGWYTKRHQIQVTDDLGRSFWVYIASFEPTRTRAVQAPWKNEYRVTAYLLDWGASGNWVGVYGSDGFVLSSWNGDPNDYVALPDGVSLTIPSVARAVWASSTTEDRALESPDQTFRRAATVYDNVQFDVILFFPDGYVGNLRLYFLDYDVDTRRQTVTVTDNSGDRTITLDKAFNLGEWRTLPINVSANSSLNVHVVKTGASNAVLSGLFLGDAGAPPPENWTRGDWVGLYGADGYVLASFNGAFPGPYTDEVSGVATVTLVQGDRYKWGDTPAQPALEGPGHASRALGTYYHATEVQLTLDFASDYEGNLYLYAYDWDPTGRRQTITVADDYHYPNQVVAIDRDFRQGVWVKVPIGVYGGDSVTITVTSDNAQNAIISGLFLGEV